MRVSLPLLRGTVLGALLLVGDRSMHAAEKSAEQGRGLSFAASALESQNNLGSTMLTSSGDNARFAASHMLLIHEQGQPLLDRVAPLLTARLQSCQAIAQIDSEAVSVKTESALAAGARAPDLFLSLELPRIKESGLVTRSLEATVVASLGNAPWQSHHTIVDDTTPPLVQFHWDGRLEHKSTMRGLETPRYRSVAEDMAKEFGNSLSNTLVKMSLDHGALPVLPDYLYGPFHPAATPAFLEKLRAKQAFSYFGLLTHNETFWKFQLGRNPAPRLQAIVDQLMAEQWKPETVLLTNSPACFIRAQRGDLRLEIFSPTDADPSLPTELDESRPLEFVAHVREPFSRAEREGALDKLLSDHASPETVMLFSRLYSGRQRQRFYELLESSRLASSAGYLSLARARLEQKNTNAAVNALIRAKALLVALPDPATAESQIQSLSKEIADSLRLPVTVDTYRQLGFIEISNAPQTISAQVSPGEPLRLFSTTDTGEPRTLCLQINAPPGKRSPPVFPWASIQTHGQGRSMTSSSLGPNRTIHLSHQPYALTIRVTPSGNLLKCEVSVEK